MKLLFANTSELKACLGFLDADLTFDNFKTDLEHATLDLTKLIGLSTYNAIQAYYDLETAYTPAEGAPTEAQMDELVKKCQDPIAMFANLAIEANTDISHTNAGRVSRVGTDERQPFEWQINRDNSAQYRRAFKALDVLINELHALSYSPWIISDEYKDSLKYFIQNTYIFNRIYDISNSRQLYLRLGTFMEDAEEEHIEPVIGSTKFTELKTAVLNMDVPEEDYELLKRIQKAVAFFALADAFKALPVEMFPEGLALYRENGVSESQQRLETQNFFKDKAKFHLNRLENLISASEAVDTDVIDPITGVNSGDKFVNL